MRMRRRRNNKAEPDRMTAWHSTVNFCPSSNDSTRSSESERDSKQIVLLAYVYDTPRDELTRYIGTRTLHAYI